MCTKVRVNYRTVVTSGATWPEDRVTTEVYVSVHHSFPVLTHVATHTHSLSFLFTIMSTVAFLLQICTPFSVLKTKSVSYNQ